MLEYLEFRITPEEKKNMLKSIKNYTVQQTRVKILNNFQKKEFIRRKKKCNMQDILNS